MSQQQSIVFEIDQASVDRFERLAKELSNLAPQIGKRAFNKTIDEGINTVIEHLRMEIRMRADNPTGRLENALGKRRTRKYEPWFWKGSVAVTRGRDRHDRNGAYYWYMVDQGHRIGKTKYFPGLNYIRAGTERIGPVVLDRMSRRAEHELGILWAKVARAIK
jgi:hypothetical protein